ncbi:MAG TPA: hypothetical protein VMS55_16250 [Myxococcota bacterium]|nr:hypothetical protein [Myxococcota bacterium]
MSSIAIASLVFLCTFVGGMLGMRSREALPEHHLSSESKDVVRLCMGLIATMTALILGLVTASAKASFDAQDAAFHSAAADIVVLDRTLAAYGRETAPLRDALRETLRARLDATREQGSPADAGAEPGAGQGERLLGGILALTPKDDGQRWQQSQALSIGSEVIKTRWLSAIGEINTVSTPFLIVIVFWLTTLFWSFGLFAPRNGTVTAVMMLSALSVSASVLLILEMQTPFSGLLRISNAPLRYALQQLGG